VLIFTLKKVSFIFCTKTKKQKKNVKIKKTLIGPLKNGMVKVSISGTPDVIRNAEQAIEALLKGKFDPIFFVKKKN